MNVLKYEIVHTLYLNSYNFAVIICIHLLIGNNNIKLLKIDEQQVDLKIGLHIYKNV